MKLVLVYCSVIVLLTGCPSAAPVPEHVYYVNPPESAGELGKFIGAWKGDWKRTVGHRLYVEEITPPYAKVIISTGWMAMEGYFDIEEGHKEVQGVFIGNDLMVKEVQDQMKIEITYRLNDDPLTLTAFGKFLPKGMSKPFEITTILHREKKDK